MTPSEQLPIRGLDPLDGKRFLVLKRDGRIEEFNEARIFLAIESAFKAHHGYGADQSLAGELSYAVKGSAERVVQRVLGRAVRGEELEVERIQDAVEEQLMQAGHFEEARCYILYREQRRQSRAAREGRSRPQAKSPPPSADSPPEPPLRRNLYREVFPKRRLGDTIEALTRRHFAPNLNEAESWQILAPAMLEIDTEKLVGQLRWERDGLLSSEGLAALEQRYLIRGGGVLLETPQYFWMRLAMGLALNESAQETWAAEFYEVLSTLRFIPAEPILLGAGTTRPRLSAPIAGAEALLELWERETLNMTKSRAGWSSLWTPEVFLSRVRAGRDWTLLDGSEASDLRACPEERFQALYSQYERKAQRGELRAAQTIPAAQLWEQILPAAARGGLAIAFKKNSPAPGAIPAGAINLAAHVAPDGSGLDAALLRETIATAVRMLDNAVDIDGGAVTASDRRSIALGVTGMTEAVSRLCASAIPNDVAKWAGETIKSISYHAILASAALAAERGPFPVFNDSDWNDDMALRQVHCAGFSLSDWEKVRTAIARQGMRNARLIGPAPGETPAQLAGLSSVLPPATAIDSIAALQQWTDLPWPLVLSPSDQDPARLSAICLEAWQKGVHRIDWTAVRAAPHPVTAPALIPV